MGGTQSLSSYGITQEAHTYVHLAWHCSRGVGRTAAEVAEEGEEKNVILKR